MCKKKTKKLQKPEYFSLKSEELDGINFPFLLLVQVSTCICFENVLEEAIEEKCISIFP